MTQTFVINLAREALTMVLLLAGPALVVGLVVGLVISIFQATTQLQDQMLSIIPKIVAIFLTLLVMGSWLLNMMVDYTTELYTKIPGLLQ